MKGDEVSAVSFHSHTLLISALVDVSSTAPSGKPRTPPLLLFGKHFVHPTVLHRDKDKRRKGNT